MGWCVENPGPPTDIWGYLRIQQNPQCSTITLEHINTHFLWPDYMLGDSQSYPRVTFRNRIPICAAEHDAIGPGRTGRKGCLRDTVTNGNYSRPEHECSKWAHFTCWPLKPLWGRARPDQGHAIEGMAAAVSLSLYDTSISFCHPLKTKSKHAVSANLI